MADFGLLQTPNFAQAALSGYQAGSALGKQKQLDAAMSAIDLERPETLLPVLRADPSTGAALIGASTKIAAEKRDMASRQAIASYIKTIAPGGGAASGAGTTASVGAAPAGVAPAMANGAPGSDQADIVVNGRPAVDPNATRNAAIDADPQGFLDIQSKIGAMDKAQRERTAEASDSFASIGQQALQLPYEQRRAFLQSHMGVLADHGVPTDKIAAFDPTDENIHAEVGQAVGIKGLIDQHDKDRTFGLQQQQFGETVHQHGVENGLSAQRVGLEAQNVGIAGAHLQLARNADARAGAAASAKATAAAPVARYEYRIVNGVTQRRLVK